MSRPNGSSLIEIVFVLLLMGVSASGLMQLQFVANQVSQDAMHRTHANIVMLSFLESVRANPQGWATYQYFASKKELKKKELIVTCEIGACSAVDRAKLDIDKTLKQMDRVLPKSFLRINQCKHGVENQCLFVGWYGVTMEECLEPNRENRCVKVEVMADGA